MPDIRCTFGNQSLPNYYTEFDDNRRLSLERIANNCVSLAMCLSGLAMLLVAVFYTTEEKGNVIPGLLIAILGVTTNTWFWQRYRRLHKAKPNSILVIQSRLYSAKAMVDSCVVTVLIAVALSPSSPAAYFLDMRDRLLSRFICLLTVQLRYSVKKLRISLVAEDSLRNPVTIFNGFYYTKQYCSLLRNTSQNQNLTFNSGYLTWRKIHYRNYLFA